jgi:hypothetical protein
MNRLLSVAVATALFGSVGASAHVPEDEWREFKAQYSALADRVNALEAENQQLRSMGAGTFVKVEDLEATNSEIAALKSQNKKTSWAEKVKWKGDFRYRYEDIDEDTKDDRQRHRVRARAALIAQASDNVEVGLGLATGGDDPVSTNQTLGGGGSTKDVRLDLAYAKWKPNDFWLAGGKVENPVYKPMKSGLIWDGDFRPEGIFGGWESEHLFAVASYIHIESDSKDDEDEDVWSVQVGGKLGPLTLAAGYIDIPTSGLAPIYDDDLFGNSADENGNYLYDYEMVTIGADASFNVWDMPLSIYGDFVENQDADDNEQGYIVGTKLGKAKNKGSWQVQYQWQRLEADAVLGLWTDSDFMGGGTDGEGHKFSAAYALQNKWTLGFTYFNGDRCFDDVKCDSRDYERLQIDTKFKY